MVYQVSSNLNSRYGYSRKTLYTDDGAIDIEVPRDRESSFEPQLVKKQQTRLTGMDDKILYLYAKGMTTLEIVTVFREMYDANVSAGLISKVTNAVMDEVIQWQSRPLEPVSTWIALS